MEAIRAENGAEDDGLLSLDLFAKILCIGGSIKRRPN